MRTCRIAVVFHRSLMLEGLVNLLREQVGLRVTSLDAAATDVTVRLKKLSPDVIIVDGERGDRPGLGTAQLLTNNPEARVIEVNPHRNEMTVCERHSVLVGKFDDFLKTVKATQPASNWGRPGVGVARRSRSKRKEASA